MSLAETHANVAANINPRRPATPTGWEPGVRYEAGEPSEVTLAMTEVPENEQAWRTEIKRVYGIELPDDRQVEIAQLRHWGTPAAPMIYVRYRITDRPVESVPVDYPALMKIARGHRKRRTSDVERTRVVLLSDLQIGKVGSGGGTVDLLARLENKIGQVLDLAKREPCQDVLIVDPGDLIENDKNLIGQAHTNDLSVPEQLEMARSILTEVVSSLAATHESTRVVTVPSNHGQYRVAIGNTAHTGKPSDDFGLDVHKAVASMFKFAGRGDVTWIIPEAWRESLAIDVRGTVVGVVHGHQWRPERAAEWWKGQSHGEQPTAAAHLLLHGHYHNASIRQSGAIGGKPRWIIAADALDNGSDWFQNLTGEVSEPSITTFTIDASGWDNYRRVVAREELA